jgi:hypothetical protein
MSVQIIILGWFAVAALVGRLPDARADGSVLVVGEASPSQRTTIAGAAAGR